MKVIISGEKQEKTYEEICKLLEIIREVKFVEVTKNGRIGFTVGKPDEVIYLIDRIIAKEMLMSNKFYSWAKKQGRFDFLLTRYDNNKKQEIRQ